MGEGVLAAFLPVGWWGQALPSQTWLIRVFRRGLADYSTSSGTGVIIIAQSAGQFEKVVKCLPGSQVHGSGLTEERGRGAALSLVAFAHALTPAHLVATLYWLLLFCTPVPLLWGRESFPLAHTPSTWS